MSLILQYHSRGYKINCGREMEFPKMSTKNIKVAIHKDDVPMTPRMISWINQPYTVDYPQLPQDDLEDADEGIGNEGNDDDDVDNDDNDNNDDDDDVDDDTNQNNDNENDDDEDDDDVDADANQNNINENDDDDDDDDDDSENDDDAIKNTDVVQMDNAGSHDDEYDRGFESLSYPNNIPWVSTHIYFNSSSSENNESDKLESPHVNEIDNQKSPSYIASPVSNSRPSSPHAESPTHFTPPHVLTGHDERKQSKVDSDFQDIVISSLNNIESRMAVIEIVESDKQNNTDMPIRLVPEVTNECNEDDNGDEHMDDMQVDNEVNTVQLLIQDGEGRNTIYYGGDEVEKDRKEGDSEHPVDELLEQIILVNTVESSIQDAEGKNVIYGGGDEKEKEDNKYMDDMKENKEDKDVKNGNKEHPVDGLIEQMVIIYFSVKQLNIVATSIGDAEGRNSTDSVAGEGEKNENEDWGDIQVNTIESSIQDAEGKNVIDGGGDENEKDDNKYMDDIQENKEDKDVKNGNKEHPVDGLIEQMVIIYFSVKQLNIVATSIGDVEGRNSTDSVAGEAEKNENEDWGDIQMNTIESSIQDAEGENVIDGGGDENEKDDNKYMDDIKENKEDKDVKNGNKEHPVDGLIEQILLLVMGRKMKNEDCGDIQVNKKEKDGKQENGEHTVEQVPEQVKTVALSIHDAEGKNVIVGGADEKGASIQQQSILGAIKAVPLAVVSPKDINDESVNEQKNEGQSSDRTSLRTDAENTDTNDGTKNENYETSKRQANSNVDRGEAFINNVQASGAKDHPIIMEVSSDEEMIDLTKKRKAAFPLEGGSSKKQKNVLNVVKIMDDWGVSFEDVVVFIEEHRKVEWKNMIFERDPAFIQNKLKDMGTFEEQIECPNQTRACQIQKKIQNKRASIDEIFKVRGTKPKSKRILKMIISRRDPKGATYTEVAHITGLTKYGYIEWMQILKCIEKQQSTHAAELRATLNRQITKLEGLGLVTTDKTHQSVHHPPKEYTIVVVCFHLALRTLTTLFQWEFIQFNICILLNSSKACFIWTEPIGCASSLECMGHIHLQKGFHMMISVELYKRKNELKIAKFQYIKPEIESDVIEFWTRAA
ncbi:hypothetical protein LXL04_023542 [Taraxacum kok-saghyz]